jgi:hypothetical protein
MSLYKNGEHAMPSIKSLLSKFLNKSTDSSVNHLTTNEDVSVPATQPIGKEKALPHSVEGSETTIGGEKSTKYPRDFAALAFAMEPRKTMAELITVGRAELRTCRSCHKKTPFPTDTPPCAIALVCLATTIMTGR